jgi:hypothetical protein
MRRPFGFQLPRSGRAATCGINKPTSIRHFNTPALMLTTMFRLVSSRLQFVTFFLLVITVIDLGHVQSTNPCPSGFTRIARDLGLKFSNVGCEGLTLQWTVKGFD